MVRWKNIFFKNWRKTSWKKVTKNCKRRQTCTFKKFCHNSKCSKTIRKCFVAGPSYCTYSRIKRKWVKSRTGCRIKRVCAFQSTCINNQCKSTIPNCQKVGKESCKRVQRFCRWSRFGKGKCFKKRCCTGVTKCFGKKCKKTFHKCTWKGLLKCKTFNFSCKLKSYKKTHKRLQCCKKERLCYGKRCKTKIVFCRWKGESHFFREKKVCQMLPIKQNKYVLVKRKQCTLWKKICVSKKRLQNFKIKNILGRKKNYYKKSKKMCNEKFIKKKYKRAHCCRFTRICQGKKCRDISKGCFWTGKKILIEDLILRWKVICRDTPFGKKKKY